MMVVVRMGTLLSTVHQIRLLISSALPGNG
jgi:hypothetical protein